MKSTILFACCFLVAGLWAAIFPHETKPLAEDGPLIGLFGWLLLLALFLLFGAWALSTTRGKILYYLLRIQWEVFRNEWAISKLSQKRAGLQHRQLQSGPVDDTVLEVVEANLEIWRAQIGAHQDIIDIYEKKRAVLYRYWAELFLLDYLRRAVKREPNASKRLARLEAIRGTINDSLHLQVKREIDKLLRAIRTEGRRGRIIMLKAELATIKEQLEEQLEEKAQLDFFLIQLLPE